MGHLLQDQETRVISADRNPYSREKRNSLLRRRQGSRGVRESWEDYALDLN